MRRGPPAEPPRQAVCELCRAPRPTGCVTEPTRLVNRHARESPPSRCRETLHRNTLIIGKFATMRNRRRRFQLAPESDLEARRNSSCLASVAATATPVPARGSVPTRPVLARRDVPQPFVFILHGSGVCRGVPLNVPRASPEACAVPGLGGGAGPPAGRCGRPRPSPPARLPAAPLPLQTTLSSDKMILTLPTDTICYSIHLTKQRLMINCPICPA